jgi:hypothetical protein
VTVVCDNIRTGQQQGMIQPDVDPEAYVTHVIALVISSVATFDTVGAVIRPGAGGAEQRARHVAELLRVARASLFVPRDRDTQRESSTSEHRPTR